MELTSLIAANIGTLIAVSAAMTIAIFFIKLRWYPLLPAAFWYVLGNYNLSVAIVRDWNNLDWTIGYLFYIFSAFCFICVLILNKKEKTIPVDNKDTREQWEIDDEAWEKRLNYYRKRRPKRIQKIQNPYDRY